MSLKETLLWLVSGPPHHVVDEDGALWRWQRALRVAVIVIGAVAAWRSRFTLNADAVSYLDLSDALVKGDWGLALNSYWSPLYPLVLAFFRSLTAFEPVLEFQVAHAANFFLFLVALTGFELILVEVLRPGLHSHSDDDPTVAPSPTLMVLVGYPLFLWSMVRLIGLHLVTPDLCVAASVFFAVAMIVRIRSGDVGPRQGAILGLVLVLGFLSKTAMLFIGTGFLGVAWIAAGFRKGLVTIVVAAAVFGAVAGSFIALLSHDEGRFTYGDSGRLNYAWHVHDVKAFIQQGTDLGPYGRMSHPPRVIHRNPRIWEFGTPISTTYPLWYDPPYWYDGLTVHFDLQRQIHRLKRTTRATIDLFVDEPIVPGLVVSVFLIALATAAGPRWRVFLGMFRPYPFLLVAVGPLLMYNLVLIRSRYLAPFVLVLVIGLLSGLPRDKVRSTFVRRWALAVAVAIVCVITFSVLADRKYQPDDIHLRVAEALRDEGLSPGDPVGVVGNSFIAYWARAGRLRIVAEIDVSARKLFWRKSKKQRARALEAFREAGAKAVIVTSFSPRPSPWVRLAGSKYYVHVF